MIRFSGLRKARYLAPLGALALLGGTMSACGDDDDDDDDPTTAATTAASSPAATTTTAAAQPTATTAQPTATTAAQPTATTAQPGATTIRVEDNAFAPESRTVTVGSEVTWQWAGSNPHSVVGTFAGAAVNSPQQTTGTFKFTFASAGTFSYICGVHGQSMSGQIVVQ
ncbi:MAG: cupredoxin domain-containing protein [Dehalococcoidia bacterium]